MGEQIGEEEVVRIPARGLGLPIKAMMNRKEFGMQNQREDQAPGGGDRRGREYS